MWATIFRPLFVQKDSALLFYSKGGDRLHQISRRLSDIAKSFGATIPPATDVRKAIATAGGALGEAEKSALAHTMSHSMTTDNTYYREYGEAKSVEGFEAVGSILEVPPGGKEATTVFGGPDEVPLTAHRCRNRKEGAAEWEGD